MIKTFLAIFSFVLVAACMPQSEREKVNMNNYMAGKFTITKVCRSPGYEAVIYSDPNGKLWIRYRGNFHETTPGVTADQIC